MATRIIAEAPSGCCFTGVKHEGTPVGHQVTIGGMETYISEPTTQAATKKILIFFADVFGPLHLNSQLLQDYFASNGFTVLGPDYFFGDPVQSHNNEPGFDSRAWASQAMIRATEAVPKWIEAVREKYGTDNAKYTAVGYCFGASFAVNLAAMDFLSAAAFAHPAFLNEDHFEKLTKPLLMSCAETDHTFPLALRRRAEDILVENKAVYHIQVFSRVSHGFAVRGDVNDPCVRWSKEECARGMSSWFERFTV